MKLQNLDFRLWSNFDNMYLTLNSDIDFLHEYGIMKTNKGEIYVIYKSNGEIDRYKNIEVEFWTGYTDKKGIKIYEGDILIYDNFKCIVKCNKDGILYPYPMYPKKNFIASLAHGVVYKYSEVIGNIHKNYNLLEGSELDNE